MTRYAARPPAREDYPEYRDHPDSILIERYNRRPASPNPEGEGETYRPVTLEWYRPDNGIYATHLTAVNGHRGNRVYVLTTPGATGTWGVRVNGIHIPVEFSTTADAKRFAQHIEDANTED